MSGGGGPVAGPAHGFRAGQASPATGGLAASRGARLPPAASRAAAVLTTGSAGW